MTYGNFAALAQKNLKRMLAYSSIAHAGYMLVGVAGGGRLGRRERGGRVGPVLPGRLRVQQHRAPSPSPPGSSATRGRDEIDDLNGLGLRYPVLAVCILLLMLSLIGMPPLAGFFGKLFMFMRGAERRATTGTG